MHLNVPWAAVHNINRVRGVEEVGVVSRVSHRRLILESVHGARPLVQVLVACEVHVYLIHNKHVLHVLAHIGLGAAFYAAGAYFSPRLFESAMVKGVVRFVQRWIS